MNRSIMIVPQGSQTGTSKSARRRQRKRNNRTQVLEEILPYKRVSVQPMAPQPRRRRNRRRGGSVAVRQSARMNPYLATILDPENVRGVKIPDAITLPTGTWSYTQDGSFALDASGQGLVLIVPANAMNSAASTQRFTVVSTSTGGATPYDLAAVAFPNISGTIARLRAVSGYVKVWSTQPPINISGTACSFLIPEGASSFALGALNSFAGFTSLPYNQVNHLAEGGVARWMATDPSEFDFDDMGSAIGNGGYNVNGVGQLFSLGNGFSAIGVALAGGNAAAAMRYRVVVNYEITPASDVQSFIDREPSPTNQAWLSSVNEFFVKSASAFFSPLANGALGSVAQISANIGTHLASQVFGSSGMSFGPRRLRNGPRIQEIDLM